MVGSLLVASLAFVAGFGQQPQNVFTEEALGEAYSAYANPSAITVQSVYPAIRGEKVERQFHTMPLRFVGKPIPLNPRLRTAFLENFRNPVRTPEPNCVFHPDHHIVFRRAPHVVEAISCFTCDELMVIADGRYLGRVSMGPSKVLRRMLSSTVPVSSSMRAGAEEWLTRELVEALSASPKGTIHRLPPNAQAPKELGAVKPAGPGRALTGDQSRRLLDILEAHAYNNRLSLTHAPIAGIRIDPPPLRIVFSSRPPAALVFTGSYSRAELYVNGKRARTLDLFGIEDRLQEFLMSLAPKP